MTDTTPPPVRVEPIVSGVSLISGPQVISDPMATVTVAAAPRPEYLSELRLTGFGTKITRVTGDTGTTIPYLGGTWAKCSRHHYSKDQPWNDDSSLLYLIQRKAADGTKVPDNSPDLIILDGSTYTPLFGNKNTTHNLDILSRCIGGANGEFRWRPTHPTQCVMWNSASQLLTVVELLSQTIVWQVHIPHACNDNSLSSAAVPRGSESFGMLGEGNLSFDGRYLVLCSHWWKPAQQGIVDEFCVVDLDAKVVGPMNQVPMTAALAATGDYGDIDWASISPSGKYVVVKFSSTSNPEYARCWKVNASTLVASQSLYDAGDNPLFSNALDVHGWLATMGHADMTTDPSPEVLTGETDVYVGKCKDPSYSNHCSSADFAALGPMITQGLEKGTHHHDSLGTTGLSGAHLNEPRHTSCRCYKDPLHALVTHYVNASNKLSDELVFWQLDSSDAFISRIATTRSDDSVGFVCEAHGVPSPDGRKVMFASNWQLNANPAYPDKYDVKAYVVDVDQTDLTVTADESRVPQFGPDWDPRLPYASWLNQ